MVQKYLSMKNGDVILLTLELDLLPLCLLFLPSLSVN